MRFWIREALGWLLVLLGLFLFYWDLSLLFSNRIPQYLEAMALLPIAIIVFRGGIHLLKVAVAARMCSYAQTEAKTQERPPADRIAGESGCDRPGLVRSIAMSAIFGFNRWQAGWLVVFCLNLIVPLYLGWDFTREGGRIGMFAAIVQFWFAGHVICGKFKTTGVIFVTGGALVSLTQFYPVLQLIAGMVAVGLCRGGLEPRPGFSDAAGFVATVVTGAELLAVASAIGAVIWAVRGAYSYNQLMASESTRTATAPETAVIDLSTSRFPQ